MNKFISSLIIIGILLLTFRVIVDNVSALDTLYENQESGGDFDWQIYTNFWHAQTFTIGFVGLNEDMYVTSISLYLKRTSTATGTFTVGIRLTSGGAPTGSTLCYGSMDASTISTSYTWYNFAMNRTDIKLSAGSKYAIIESCSGGTATKNIKDYVDSSTGSYTGGNMYYSDTSGSTWSTYNTYDNYFRIYGKKAITSWNMTISNLSPVNNSNMYKTINYNVISSKYNYTYTNFANISFLKNATEGKNSTSKVYFNNTLLYTGTWINGSRTINLLQNYGKSLVNHVNYTWSINNSYQYIWHNYSYHFTFHINITNLPKINSTCDNTSLTVYNNTVNTTGKYTSIYSSLTGWKLWMNFTGLKTYCGNTSLTVYNNTVNTTGKYETSYNSSTGNKIWLNFTGLNVSVNISGYSEEDLFFSGSSVFLFSIIGMFIVKRRKRKI